LGVRIDDRPNLAVHLIRQEWYGSDRFDPDPAPPPRVAAGDSVQLTACPRRVPASGEPCPDREPDEAAGAVGHDYPEHRFGLAGEDADSVWADNANQPLDQTSLGGTPSDIRPGGMLDVFA
jgi:hypothetical protein